MCGASCKRIRFFWLTDLPRPVLQRGDRDAALFGELGEGKSLSFAADQEGAVVGRVSSGVLRYASIFDRIAFSINVGRMRRLPGNDSRSSFQPHGVRWVTSVTVEINDSASSK